MVRAVERANPGHADYPARLLLSRPTDGIRRRVLANLRMANGVYRCSYAQRLDDVDELVLRHLGAPRQLRIVDVAASSCITTYEWWRTLRERGFEAQVTATDIAFGGFLLSIGRNVHLFFDENGSMLQSDIFGRVREGSDHQSRRVPARLARFLRRTLVPRPPVPARASDGAQRGSRRPIRRQWVSLVDPAAEAIPSLVLTRGDLLAEPLGLQADVVRVANFLNLAYFKRAELQLMVRRVSQSVKPAGLLVICRTHDVERNHASLFRFEDGRFTVLDRLGAGSEVEDLVVER